MIDLNDKIIKTYFNALIDAELANINASLEKQKDLSSEILKSLNEFHETISSSADVDTLSSTSSELVSISKLLDKISLNFSYYEELANDLKKMKDTLSISDNKTIDDIAKYNKTYANRIKQITANIAKVEKFITQNNITLSITPEEIAANIAAQEAAELAETQKAQEAAVQIIEEVSEEILLQETVIEEVSEEIPEEAVNISSLADNIEIIDETPTIEPVQPVAIAEEPSVVETLKIAEETPVKPIVEVSSETNPIPTETTKFAFFTENTLIISDKEDKVFLPYTIAELEDTIKENPKKYKSLEDVINKLYTKPLKYYKSPSKARFKEAFNLIKNKESGSFGAALDLGMELISNGNLHPAIITACKNLDELDIYLSCLEYNELSDFKFFNIVYDALPSKKRSSSSNKKAPQRGKHTPRRVEA